MVRVPALKAVTGFLPLIGCLVLTPVAAVPLSGSAGSCGIDPASDPNVKPLGDPALAERYELAWSDEFNGSEIDQTRWEFRQDAKHWSAQLPRNIVVSDGVCSILLKKEKVCDKEYTGGGIISRAYFGFGYYEARLRVPAAAGWHTAFWMMDNHHAHDDTSQVELDPMENDSIDPQTFSVDYHQWRSPLGHVKAWRAVHRPDDSLTDFHVIGMEWTPEAVHYYFDGELVRTTTHLRQQFSGKEKAPPGEPRTIPVSEIETNEVQIWFSCIATWLGDTEAVDDSGLPGAAQCDYIRFFRKKP